MRVSEGKQLGRAAAHPDGRGELIPAEEDAVVAAEGIHQGRPLQKRGRDGDQDARHGAAPGVFGPSRGAAGAEPEDSAGWWER